MYSFNIRIINILFAIDMLYVADPGYNDRKLYEYSKKVLGIDLACPVVERYESTPKRDLSLYVFINRHYDRQSTTREEYR